MSSILISSYFCNYGQLSLNFGLENIRQTSSTLFFMVPRPVPKGEKTSLNFFLEKYVEHSLKNLGPIQKTLRPTW